MTERVIVCNGASAPEAGQRLQLDLSGPARNFRLEVENISEAMATDVPPRLLDVLEIAAFVFAADQSIRRGGSAREDWGEAWRRSLRFRLPVRDIEFWSRGDVGLALTSALSFLSDDRYAFSFERAKGETRFREYLALEPDAEQGFFADEVILFSGGADSLAGAVETLETTQRRIALVSHRSAPKILQYQKRLADVLRARYPGRVFPLRIYATRFLSGDAPDPSRATRSMNLGLEPIRQENAECSICLREPPSLHSG